MVAQVEAQRIIDVALEEAVVSQQTELMAQLVDEADTATMAMREASVSGTKTTQ